MVVKTIVVSLAKSMVETQTRTIGVHQKGDATLVASANVEKGD